MSDRKKLYLLNLVPTCGGRIWHKNMQNWWGGTRGNIPGIDILTAGEEIVPKTGCG